MELRVGIVLVKVICYGGFRTRIAKMQVSQWGTLAMFSGGGLAYAEKLIKDPETSVLYETQSDSAHKEDHALFEGLECRWEPIVSKKGETLHLMVLAQGGNDLENSETYSKFIEKIRKIYGSQRDYSAVSPRQLKVTLNSKLLALETKV